MLVFLCALCLFGSPAEARVKEVRWVGVSPAERRELRKATRLETRWWSLCSEEKLKRDVERIKQFFLERGYADVQVSGKRDEVRGKEKVSFQIEKGTQYKLRSLSLSGQEICKEEELLELLPRYFYVDPEIHTPIISAFYGQRGYLQTSVDWQTTFQEEWADVTGKITEGEETILSDVRIEGLTRTREELVRKSIPLKKGEICDTSRIANTYSKLCELELFKEIKLYVQDKELIVDLKELDQQGKIWGSLDFTETRGINATLGIAQSNFSSKDLLSSRGLIGGGERLQLEVTGRIAQLSFPSKDLVSSQKSKKKNFQLVKRIRLPLLSYECSWESSPIEKRRWNSSVSGGSVEFTGYKKKWQGGEVRLSSSNEEGWGWHLHGRGVGREYTTEKENLREETFDSSGKLAAIGGGLSYQTSGWIKGGFYADIEGVAARHKCIKTKIEGNCRIPCLWGFLHQKCSLKAIALGKAAMSERFYLYEDEELHIRQPEAFGPKIDEIEVGGQKAFLVSSEYRQEIGDGIEGFAFINAFQISNRLRRTPAVTCGGGIRVNALGGLPVVIGIGTPLHQRREMKLFVQLPSYQWNWNFPTKYFK